MRFEIRRCDFCGNKIGEVMLDKEPRQYLATDQVATRAAGDEILWREACNDCYRRISKFLDGLKP